MILLICDDDGNALRLASLPLGITALGSTSKGRVGRELQGVALPDGSGSQSPRPWRRRWDLAAERDAQILRRDRPRQQVDGSATTASKQQVGSRRFCVVPKTPVHTRLVRSTPSAAKVSKRRHRAR